MRTKELKGGRVLENLLRNATAGRHTSRRITVALFLSTISVTSARAGEPSFDCSKASSWSERTVCDNGVLADLDAQMAALYRNMSGRLSGSELDALKQGQLAWLRQREGCKANADTTECLRGIYRERIVQLDSRAPSAQASRTEGQSSAQSLGVQEIGPQHVWSPPGDATTLWRDIQAERCNLGRGEVDITCVVTQMRQHGASPEAIAFTESMNGEVYLGEFQELGKVDLGTVVAPLFNDPNIERSVLLNGSPQVMELDAALKLDLAKHPDYAEIAQTFPEAKIWPMAGFESSQTTEEGGQEFFFSFILLNGCRACEVAGEAKVSFDVGHDGAFRGARIVSLSSTGAAASSGSPQSASQENSQGEEVQTDEISVSDGSTLAGNLSGGRVPFESSFGSIEVSVDDVQSYAKDELRLADGSVLKGSFGAGVVTVTTSFGAVEVPLQNIVSITRASGEVAAPAGASPAPGQGVLTGKVVDNFGTPVAGATVQIAGTTLRAETQNDGSYQVPYVPGDFAVSIEHIRYDPTSFALKLTQASTYPIEDKVLLRLPPQSGVYFWDTDGWSPLGECTLQQTSAIPNDGRIDFKGVRKDAYRVVGSPYRVVARGKPVFLAHTPVAENLLVYRVDQKGEIVTRTFGGGFGGVFGMLSDSGSSKGTSIAKAWKTQPFPNRSFLLTNNEPGVYAIVDREYQNACFLFQIGDAEFRVHRSAPNAPSEADTLAVDGREVTYWRSPAEGAQALFRFDSKGYRNTYSLDCANKRFLWTENVRFSTGDVTGNNAGSEWRPMSPKSTISNAVYDAICPGILSGTSTSDVVTAGTDENRTPTIGTILDASIAGGCHCSVNKVSQSGEKIWDQYLFAADYEGKARLNVDGRDVNLRETERKEKPGEYGVCSGQGCTYSGDGITATVDYKETRRCPPEPTECEVTDYDVKITVLKNGQQQSVTGKGQCGC